MEAYHQFGNSRNGTKIHLYLNKEDIEEMRHFTDTDSSIHGRLIVLLLKEIDENER